MPSGLTASSWEAHILAELGEHPNIATVIDHWEDSQSAIMVTRYLSGERLEDEIVRSDSGLPVLRILQLSTEIASGLAYMHERRILYCDLQPHNVLLDEGGTAHLVDFDTAVKLNHHDVGDLSRHEVVDYMAPELIEGESADERADLFSLGATIYQKCSGRPPFVGSREQVLVAQRAEPPLLQREDLPAGLPDLVFCLLAFEPDQRPTSATDVLTRLDALQTDYANRNRLMSSDLSTVLKASLGVYFKAVSGTFAGSPARINLPDDHRYLMQAIIALAEADYRRAVIDAGTATEVALTSVLSKFFQKKGWERQKVDRIIRDSNGLDGLYMRYCSFVASPKLPVSRAELSDHLGKVRNDAAHRGRIPPGIKATRAVELAYRSVNAIHPFISRLG